MQTDIADEDSAKNCAAATKKAFGSIDVLINNAALYFDIDNANNDPAYLKKVFDVNLHGAWMMIRAVAPYMVEQGGGRIINQSSGAAYSYILPPMGDDSFHEVGAFSYSQTKWGVIGLTKFMAAQLGKHGITVNCIAPGVTMTEATKKIVPEEYMGMITFMTAMRTTLQPEDIAGCRVLRERRREAGDRSGALRRRRPVHAGLIGRRGAMNARRIRGYVDHVQRSLPDA